MAIGVITLTFLLILSLTSVLLTNSVLSAMPLKDFAYNNVVDIVADCKRSCNIDGLALRKSNDYNWVKDRVRRG